MNGSEDESWSAAYVLSSRTKNVMSNNIRQETLCLVSNITTNDPLNMETEVSRHTSAARTENIILKIEEQLPIKSWTNLLSITEPWLISYLILQLIVKGADDGGTVQYRYLYTVLLVQTVMSCRTENILLNVGEHPNER